MSRPTTTQPTHRGVPHSRSAACSSTTGPVSGHPQPGAGPTISSPGANEGFIYFMATPGGTYVKVGWARDPERRLIGVQTGCPLDVCLCGTVAGSKDDERRIHRQLRQHRVRGEWYDGGALILAQELCADFEPPGGRDQAADFIAACRQRNLIRQFDLRRREADIERRERRSEEVIPNATE